MKFSPRRVTVTATKWHRVQIDGCQSQVDIQGIDEGDSDATIALQVSLYDPSSAKTVVYRPVSAGQVWELTPPHIPREIWVRAAATGLTTPVVVVTHYPEL